MAAREKSIDDLYKALGLKHTGGQSLLEALWEERVPRTWEEMVRDIGVTVKRGKLLHSRPYDIRFAFEKGVINGDQMHELLVMLDERKAAMLEEHPFQHMTVMIGSAEEPPEDLTWRIDDFEQRKRITPDEANSLRNFLEDVLSDSHE